MGSQNTYLGSFLVSHKQHGFQSETHSLITDRVLGASYSCCDSEPDEAGH